MMFSCSHAVVSRKAFAFDNAGALDSTQRGSGLLDGFTDRGQYDPFALLLGNVQVALQRSKIVA
jgi:hypothetical protein